MVAYYEMTDNRANKIKGPQFIRFLKPIIEVLRESGGSGTSSEVTDKVIERLDISDEEQSVILKSGQSRVYNQVHWARMYLVHGGIVDSSKRGVWTLTEEGNKTNLEQFNSHVFYKTVHQRQVATRTKKEATGLSQDTGTTDEQSDEREKEGKTDLLEILKGLSPAGF